MYQRRKACRQDKQVVKSNWTKRPHCRHTWTVQWYSPGGTTKMHASLGPPESTTQTVQPFLHSSRQSVVGHADAYPLPNDRQIKSRLGTGMQTNLGACNDQSNQTAVVRSRALHAVVQALSEVRKWILCIVYCSHSNKQSIFTETHLCKNWHRDIHAMHR